MIFPIWNLSLLAIQFWDGLGIVLVNTLTIPCHKTLTPQSKKEAHVATHSTAILNIWVTTKVHMQQRMWTATPNDMHLLQKVDRLSFINIVGLTDLLPLNLEFANSQQIKILEWL